MYLSDYGVKLVAVSDSKGGIYSHDGLDYGRLRKIKEETGSVINYKPAKVLKASEIFELPVDLLIPASVSDVINTKNMDKIEAKIIVEGANIPVMLSSEEHLWKKGVLIIPDIIANAGGVVSSYAEYIGENPQKMFEMIEKKITKNVKHILKKSADEEKSPRSAALEIVKKEFEMQ